MPHHAHARSPLRRLAVAAAGVAAAVAVTATPHGRARAAASRHRIDLRGPRRDIFLTPTGNGQYANGVEILGPDGKHVVWSRTVPAGQTAADFRTQTYRGRPVLTWWQGTGLGGLASGVDEIYNEHYQQIGEVRAGNGYTADGHEFLITP